MENYKIKIASFNISGGFYIGNEETEYLDREAVNSVDNKLLGQIIDLINKENIDIICFQEIITTERINYIKSIVDKTELKYYDFFELSECNIVKNTECGLAVLSRFPITESTKQLFPNPRLTKTTSSGKTYSLFDKGLMLCNVQVGCEKYRVLTHHGFPYRRFNSTPEANMKVFEFFDEFIAETNPHFITGDFNADDFMILLKNTSKKYKRTFDCVTTVDGKKFDDILIFKDYKCQTKIIKLLSDHFMIINKIK